jgi:steroid delta-isomerase
MGVDDAIRATVSSYLETFTAGDREAWLDLFTADATVEDPVGTAVRKGRDAIGEFWDATRGATPNIRLKLVQGPGVCGNVAAWAMEAHVDLGESTIIAPTIDVMSFTDDGHIETMQAFWSPGDARPA